MPGRKVYPRVCGGTTPWQVLQSGCKGLSPRVRGNPPLNTRGGARHGSIPACAGEPKPDVHVVALGVVYPRVCGGTPLAQRQPPLFGGLSPRVRGNLAVDEALPSGERSIPACAGEPVCGGGAAPNNTVYPRVCGGTADSAEDWVSLEGLSPRVRGNRRGEAGERGDEGSIPACAGEPGGCRRRQTCRWVYPRVCGGTPVMVTALPTLRGLSPRVRGNRRVLPPLNELKRSIPACAGEPVRSHYPETMDEVYPRVCGGTARLIWPEHPAKGLSPRVRGNLQE